MSRNAQLMFVTALLLATCIPRDTYACCRFDSPRFDPVRIPPVGEVLQQSNDVVTDLGRVVGKITGDPGKEIGIGLGNIARESKIAGGNVVKEGRIITNNVATTVRRFGSDASEQGQRSQRDLEDAATAIYRFSVNQIKGYGTALSHAEQRFREGKVVDALFHLSLEPAQNLDSNAAQAAAESSLLSTVASVAASVYGQPPGVGAAAYAAWLTYHQTGDVNMALKMGIIAGVSSFANGQAATMDAVTLTDSVKRAAVVGAIGGAAVAASGGDVEAINTAFLRGGAAIIIKDGYKAYVERDITTEFKPALGEAMCSPANPALQVSGCPNPSDYFKDKEGRLVMTDRDGAFHHVDVDQAKDVPSDWIPVGNSSTTPQGTPVVGIQTAKLPAPTQQHEGSVVMRNLAKVPGMNAMALFHDRWAVAWEMGPSATKVSIVPTIVLTYIGATVVLDNASTTPLTNAIKIRKDEGKSLSPIGPANGKIGQNEILNTDKEAQVKVALSSPTIAQLKPPDAKVETLLCNRGAAFRAVSILAGKGVGDLQCIVALDTDGEVVAPFYAKNDAGFCARKLVSMGRAANRAGWSCRFR